jgi:hypothetical protein
MLCREMWVTYDAEMLKELAESCIPIVRAPG